VEHERLDDRVYRPHYGVTRLLHFLHIHSCSQSLLPGAYLKRTSFYFRPRFDRYTTAIALVTDANDYDPFGELAIRVAEAVPETPGEPSVVYLLGCVLSPVACLTILGVIIVGKVLYEGSVDDDPDDPEGNGGGVCEPEMIEDVDGGVCYPE
jgi:hypothetical protein